jgi:hypothetical protein
LPEHSSAILQCWCFRAGTPSNLRHNKLFEPTCEDARGSTVTSEITKRGDV